MFKDLLVRDKEINKPIFKAFFAGFLNKMYKVLSSEGLKTFKVAYNPVDETFLKHEFKGSLKKIPYRNISAMH